MGVVQRPKDRLFIDQHRRWMVEFPPLSPVMGRWFDTRDEAVEMMQRYRDEDPVLYLVEPVAFYVGDDLTWPSGAVSCAS